MKTPKAATSRTEFSHHGVIGEIPLPWNTATSLGTFPLCTVQPPSCVEGYGPSLSSLQLHTHPSEVVTTWQHKGANGSFQSAARGGGRAKEQPRRELRAALGFPVKLYSGYFSPSGLPLKTPSPQMSIMWFSLSRFLTASWATWHRNGLSSWFFCKLCRETSSDKVFKLQVFSHVPIKLEGFPIKKKSRAVPSLFPDATPSTSSFKAPYLSQCLQILPFLLCMMLLYINDTKWCQKWQNYTQDINITATNVPMDRIKLESKGPIMNMTHSFKKLRVLTRSFIPFIHSVYIAEGEFIMCLENPRWPSNEYCIAF